MSSGVEFEEDSFGSSGSQPTFRSESGRSSLPYSSANEAATGMSGWLIKHGLAKSAKSANMVLLGFVVFNIIISIIAINFFL